MRLKITKLKILAIGCVCFSAFCTIIFHDLFYLGGMFVGVYFWVLKDKFQQQLDNQDFDVIRGVVTEITEDLYGNNTMNTLSKGSSRFIFGDKGSKVKITIETKEHEIYHFNVLRKDIFNRLLKEEKLNIGVICEIYLKKDTSLSLIERFIEYKVISENHEGEKSDETTQKVE